MTTEINKPVVFPIRNMLLHPCERPATLPTQCLPQRVASTRACGFGLPMRVVKRREIAEVV